MQLKPNQLPRLSLQVPWPPLILLHGPEEGLARETLHQLRQTLLGNEDETVFDSEGLSGPELETPDLLQSLRRKPLFAAKRVVVLHRGDELQKGVLEALLDYLATPAPRTVLIVLAGTLEAKNPLRKAIDASPSAWSVAYYPLEGAAFRNWIRQRLNQAGLQADDAALELMAQLSQGNSQGAEAELDKLVLYMGGGRSPEHGGETSRKVGVEEVAAIMGETALLDPFGLAGPLFNGDAATAVRTLERLLAGGEEPIMLLGGIARRIRQVALGQAQMRQGKSPPQVFASLRIFWKEQEAFLNQCQGLSDRALADALLACLEADIGLKGGATAADQVLERLFFRLASLLRYASSAPKAEKAPAIPPFRLPSP
ncbi:MAG: DNA polymerase III subunit delta [Magnetococcales bacterium]|nr:DNA polymerase III subunit delta [Magnetococcales bacterium]